MGGRGGSSGFTSVSPVSTGVLNFHNITDDEVKAIIDEQEEEFDIDAKLAIKQYISKNPMGNGYSMSQNLNYALENGLKLNANEQYMDQELTRVMHPIGYDINLNRAAHSDIFDKLGVKNYESLSSAQLNQRLTGAEWTTKSFASTSYDMSKNPFISGSQAGGREVIMNIKAPGSVKGIFVNKAQAEVVLAKGTRFKITSARFSGKTVYPRVGGARKQVILEIELS